MNSKPSFIRPQIAKGCHPIEAGGYVISTPSVYEMGKEVSEWLDLRQSGGMIYGPPRLGKTSAIKYVERKLLHDFEGKLPIVTFECQSHTIAREGEFFTEFLQAIGHELAQKGKIPERRERLYQYLRNLAERNPHRRLVIFLDEAQKLHKDHYSWLVDIYNNLDRAKIASTFILVGQQELANRRNAMVIAKQFQVVGRFMVNARQFSGISNAKEVQVCLHGYDEQSEYPEESGWSYTRFYFPVAYEHGWRLASQAENVWKAFMEARESGQLPGPAQIPMKFLTGTIEYVMRRYENLIDIEPHLSLQVWREAVKKSQYQLSGDFISADEEVAQ